MKPLRELASGERFGRWSVVAKADPGKGGHARYERKCSCGNGRIVHASSLLRGISLSCGCLCRERTIEALTTHGQARLRTGTYRTWKSMCQRVRAKTGWFARYYAARGIGMCKRWEEFENFFADMGERPPGLSIDRIDNDRGYEPGNCRWATQKQQVRNMRRKLGAAGVRGVTRRKSGGYCAQINIGGQMKNLGTYRTAEEAGKAYAAARARLDGDEAQLRRKDQP